MKTNVALTIANALEAAMRTYNNGVGITQNELSRLSSVPQPTISRTLKAKTIPETRTLARLIAVLGAENVRLGQDILNLLPGVTEPKALGQSAFTRDEEGAALPEDLVLVPEYNVSFSAGNGQIIYEVEEGAPKVYAREWFIQEHIDPRRVKRFKVRGDSMEPVLYNGDSVLVNLAENIPEQIIDGKIYAIRYANELRVKRLFRKLDGSLVLHSDNAAYKEEAVSPMLVQEYITIIGRVRDKSGAGGL